jgi:hypothetical protein
MGVNIYPPGGKHKAFSTRQRSPCTRHHPVGTGKFRPNLVFRFPLVARPVYGPRVRCRGPEIRCAYTPRRQRGLAPASLRRGTGHTSRGKGVGVGVADQCWLKLSRRTLKAPNMLSNHTRSESFINCSEEFWSLYRNADDVHRADLLIRAIKDARDFEILMREKFHADIEHLPSSLRYDLKDKLRRSWRTWSWYSSKAC